MKAIFLKDFHYTSRRVNAGWHIKANPKAQNWPREVVMAAILRRAAVPVLPRRKP